MARKRLLILGTGFASFALLRRIDVRSHDVTVVSPRNHFVFTPLLPSTTVGTIEFRTAIESVRAARRGIAFRLGRAVQINLDRSRVTCEGPGGSPVWEEPFDVLALGIGCVTNTFGTPGVAEHTYFLKEVEDARAIRQKLIANLELASLPGVTVEVRSRLLHFAAVGAGPTGVRFAAELYDLLRKELPRSYPDLVDAVRVSLIDAGHSVLGSYDQSLREYVGDVFRRRGVKFYPDCRVIEVDASGVRLADGRNVPAGLVLWCAGFARHPVVAALGVEKDAAGRIVTDEYLQVGGSPCVYAMGDCARPASGVWPQLAQVAEQQGRYVASRLNGHTKQPFRWRPWGVSSYIGQGAAVVESPTGGRTSGFWAYQQWRAAVWSQLVSHRSRVLVPLDRLRAFLFGRELSRL